MLPLKFIRENPQIVKDDLKKRQDHEKLGWLDEVLRLDENWRKLKQESEKLRQKRNELTDEVRKLKKDGKSAEHVLKEVKEIPDHIAKIEEEQNKAREGIDYILMRLPNILHDSVPQGKSEEENVKVKEWESQ